MYKAEILEKFKHLKRLKVTGFYAAKMAVEDARYRSPEIEYAIKEEASERYKDTELIEAILRHIFEGQSYQNLIVKDAPNEQKFISFDHFIRNLNEFVSSYTPELLMKYVNDNFDAILRDEDKEDIQNASEIMKLYITKKTLRMQIYATNPEAAKYLRGFNEPGKYFMKLQNAEGTIQTETKGNIATRFGLDYYACIIASSYLSCKEFKYYRLGKDDSDELLTIEKEALRRASLYCVMAQENDEACYYKDEISIVASSGGKAKAEKYRTIKEKIKELLASERPADGWESYTQAVNLLCGEANGCDNDKLLDGLLAKFQKEQVANNHDATIISDSNLRDTVKKWISGGKGNDPDLNSTFLENASRAFKVAMEERAKKPKTKKGNSAKKPSIPENNKTLPITKLDAHNIFSSR